jgi:hypothetical protein
VGDILRVRKRGDRAQALRVDLKHGDGSAVDLTGISVSDIRVYFRPLPSGVTYQGAGTVAVVGAATLGQVSYTFSAADVGTAQQLQVEIEVTFVGGTDTYPVDDRLIIRIDEDID